MKIEYIFAVFALIGVADRISGNHFKLGEEFEKGIMATGTLILAMSGILVLSPIIASVLTTVFKPLSELFHLDMSVVAGFFPNDGGGAAIAYNISDDVRLRGYNGLIVGGTLGAGIMLIPMALKMIDEKFHEDVLIGLLCGFATIPIGCIIAGIFIGCNIGMLILNSIPMIIISVMICVGLVFRPVLCRKIFKIFGNILLGIIIAGLGIGIFHQLTGVEIIPGISPLQDTFLIIGNIAIILSGVFPLLAIISRVFNKLFVKLGNLLKINSFSILGIITTLANCIPMFDFIDKMDKKGRIMNMAFAVSAAYALGDHLAFTIAFDRSFLLPMTIAKIVSGIAALVTAYFVADRKSQIN